MRTFLLSTFLLCILGVLILLGMIAYESSKKRYKYKIKSLLKITVSLVVLCIITVTMDFSIENRENKNKLVQTSNSKNISDKSTSKENKYTSLLESDKSFNDLDDNEKENFFDLIKNWSSQNQSFKDKFNQRKESLEQQKDDYFKKEHDASKEKYAQLINNIENDFPEMKVNYISEDKNKSDEKTLNIDMKLLQNVDSTKLKCSELTVKKETNMKNSGITKINIYIKNNGEHAGLIFFELRDGEYHPTLVHVK